MLKNLFFATGVVLLFAGCFSKPEQVASTLKVVDPKEWVDEHTLSNADSVAVRHLHLDIAVDMVNRQISGNALWTINNNHHQKELILDTYDLTIDSVMVDGHLAGYQLDSPIKFLGSALHIPINENTKFVMVHYKTGPRARALQWLDPQQTHDKRAPFLYTQSESIYARSWIPCPDGPGIRFTYTARVTVPQGLMALMSAENSDVVNDTGVYNFRMPIPIPAYLMALAVGDLAFKGIDDRTGVYAEKGMIDKARWEFENVGRMVGSAEQLYGAYRWGRYDVVVLPPGFPIGGMENPKLTFLTPTIIAGDRSLVSLVAHELAHSWSGNLVTNATWNDFWLNEGFTNYFERRIMEQMMGESYSDMLWELGYQDLQNEVMALGADSRDTWLKLDLKGRDPDDGLNSIPYEKGCHFLKMIEKAASRDRFDKFLVKYFDANAFRTITTETFLNYMDTVLIKKDTVLRKALNIDEWVYGPGIPANCPRARQELFSKVDAERTKFLSGMPAEQIAFVNWSAHEWLHFLRGMPDTLRADKMVLLDRAFNFSTTGNSELADEWYLIAIRANYRPAYPAMERFLSTVGRRKFLEPLYIQMMKTPEGQEMARKLYTRYKENYHPLAQESLDRIVLKLP
ncbi:M1 family metallopeptidase [Nemorincola caseinilytica]|uniref:Aminopeptidase N n=1 Tax=Nemorincola caseinilytica TaxID=2054315 RepID=A0ABP8NA11_9BACT